MKENEETASTKTNYNILQADPTLEEFPSLENLALRKGFKIGNLKANMNFVR